MIDSLIALLPLIKMYFMIAFWYTVFYVFMKGAIKQTWEFKDLLEGLFFPVSIANELGVLISYLPLLFNKERLEKAREEAQRDIDREVDDLHK